MSDEPKKDEAKAKDGKAAAEAPAKPGKGAAIKAIVGPVLAVVVLVGGGVAGGFFLSGMVTPSKIAQQQGMDGPKDPHATEGEGGHAGEGEGGHGDGKDGDHKGHSLLHSGTELAIDSIISNVRDTGGKRFVKISPAFWILTEAGTAIGLGGGGGHGGGGEAAGETKRILRARIQEHLKEYSMDELTSKGIERKLEKTLRDIVEKELHALCPEIPAAKQIVIKVVPADLAVQ